MLQKGPTPEETLARVEAAIAEFEGRPDRIRRSALIEALYRQRAQLRGRRPRYLDRDW
jgi:hypothetical protein